VVNHQAASSACWPLFVAPARPLSRERLIESPAATGSETDSRSMDVARCRGAPLASNLTQPVRYLQPSWAMA